MPDWWQTWATQIAQILADAWIESTSKDPSRKENSPSGIDSVAAPNATNSFNSTDRTTPPPPS